jgi:Wiskott-Aldrich syndrome protein
MGVLLFIVFAVLFAPYTICYISVLYVASGGDIAVVPAGGGRGALPPAPPAPPSYGGHLGTPPAYSMPPREPVSADAWKAAADPLASPPPPPPRSSLSSGPPAGDHGGATVVTDLTPPDPPAAPPPAGGA